MAPPRRLTRGPTALPPYEPPYTPLSAGRLQQLGVLVDGGGRPTAIDKLANTLADTLNTLGGVAADLGELVPVGQDDHDEEQAEKQALLDELEAMARSLVDASHKAKEMKATLSLVVTGFRDEAREAKRRQRDEEEDEHEATKITGEREGMLGKYEDGLKKKLREYDALSMTAKYAQTAEYIEFRKYLWNAQHPDQRNNLPRANTWFLHLEGGRRKSQAHLDDDEDSDIEIAQEKQSYKCPLTIKRFEHPVTSTVCPHSFEKTAIEDYIRLSGGASGVASCPVTGCSKELTLEKLRPDLVLERDVRRAAQSAQRRRQEEEDNTGEDIDEDVDEDEDEEMVDVDNSPRKQSVAVKNEKGKKQLGRGRGIVLDIDSEDDED